MKLSLSWRRVSCRTGFCVFQRSAFRRNICLLTPVRWKPGRGRRPTSTFRTDNPAPHPTIGAATMQNTAIIKKLNEILAHEWTGVAQYAQQGFMVRGLWRESYAGFFMDGAEE